MKYGLGGSLFHIAVAAIEITMLIKRIKNVPTKEFLALPKRLEIANDKEIAVLIQTISKMIIGPGLIETISRRNAAATKRKIIIEINADSRKSR